MQAIRQRTACIARQTRPSGLRNSRSYASDHGHGHHHAEPVKESIGYAFWATAAVVPAAWLLYVVAQPGKEGEDPFITRKIQEYWHWQATWEERNALHTKAVEQAGFDRTLFLHADRNKTFELRYPEIFQSHASRNIPAGSLANLDHVIAHYKKQHLDEEDRKALKLAKQQG